MRAQNLVRCLVAGTIFLLAAGPRPARAEIIGETTAGGAHPVGRKAIDDRLKTAFQRPRSMNGCGGI